MSVQSSNKLDSLAKQQRVVEVRDIKLTQGIDTSFLDVPKDELATQGLKAKIAQINPDKTAEDLFSMKKWDVRGFDTPHLPVIVGSLKDPQVFSQQKGLRLLDMAIYMPNQGWAIPVELEQFKETIKLAYEHEKLINPEIDKYFIYITVDQKLVQPNSTQRRPGYHSDAFETEETENISEVKWADNTYIVYDAIPTLFQAGPFPIKGNVDPEDCEEVLKLFDRLADGKPPTTFPTHAMVKLTPYDVHTPAVNETGHQVERTFIKISFSRKHYNLIGNRINDTVGKDGKQVLDYSDWQWVPRDPYARNHRNKLVKWHRVDQDKFTLVDIAELDFNNAQANPEWLDNQIIYAQRTQHSHAVKATKGDSLETKYEGSLVTYNIAQEGDWKITTVQGSEYFISDKRFNERYKIESKDENDFYMPKGEPQPMIKVNRDICFRAPWGAMQYISAGGYLTLPPKGRVHGIQPNDFKATYTVCNKPNVEVENAGARKALDGEVISK